MNDERPSAPRRASASSFPAALTFAAFLVITSLAAALRFWQLDARTFTGDEAILSLIARQAAFGSGYEHLPLDHGPMHVFGTAALFSAFGVNDAAARALPALAGVLLAALPFLFTRHLGRAGAVAASLLLAVSPSMLFYSRFAAPDVTLAFFTLAAAMAVWRYLAAPHRVYLYALSAALACAVVTSEMALVAIAIFAAYLCYRVAGDLFAQMREEAAGRAMAPLTHYERLELEQGATAKEIRVAYHRLFPLTGTKRERDAVLEAYHVLTDPNRREAYDRKLARRAAQAAQQEPVAMPGARAYAALLAGAWAIAAAWPFARGIRERAGLRRLPDAASPLLVLSLLTLPFYGPLVEKLAFVGDRGFSGQEQVYVLGGANRAAGGELPVMFVTLGALFGVAMVAGFAWRWHLWVMCFAIFYGIAITMFTGFFTNGGGVWTGLWGTLDYWWRPGANDTREPAYFYAMLLPVYEFLPLAVVAIAALLTVARGAMRERAIVLGAAAALAAVAAMPAATPLAGGHRIELMLAVAGASVLAMRVPELTKFFAFWAVAAFFAFTYLDLKQGSLAVHVALPLALLGGKLIDSALASVAMPRVAMPVRMPRAGAPLRRRLAQGLVAGAFAAVAVVTMRSGMVASWGHGPVPQLQNALAVQDRGDTPIELFESQPSAPDVRAVRDAIERAGAQSGKGTTMPVVLDTSNEFAKTWLWYLRDYKNLTLQDMRRGYDVPADAIALVSGRNRARVRIDPTALAMTFTQRWSFPAEYGGRTRGGVASELASADAWARWARYFRDRTSAGTPRAVEGVAVFPQALEASLPATRASDVLSIAVTPEAGAAGR